MDVALGHCALQTRQLDRALDFYENVLGLEKHFFLRREDGSIWLVYLRTKSGQFIELFNIPDGDFSPHNATFRHFCLIVNNIEQAAAELQEKKQDLYYGPTTMGNLAPSPFIKHMGKCGSYGFFICDPDGNQIEFHEFTPMSLQTMSPAQIQELQPLIDNNTYVLEAAWQGNDDAKFPQNKF